MNRSGICRYASALACFAVLAPVVLAQNSIQVFSPVNVRASASGTSYASPNTFNSATLSLNCSASPIKAVLSSSANGAGNLLVDNFMTVAVGQSAPTGTAVNVCTGGTSDSTQNGTSQDCFNTNYQSSANAGQLTGQDPDNFASTGGIAPIDISSTFLPGSMQVQINLVDGGGFLASSSIYLDTNCTQTGVTGPAGVTGNPIPQSNPNQQQLTQTFTFNSTANQGVQFVYNLSQAQAAGTLTIQDGTIPGTEDSPVDPTTFQSTLVPNTSFATSICLVHTGETLNGAPACKLFTLECTVGTGSTESGAQCPVSSLPNELFQDIFDGPAFTLPDIQTPGGTTFHEGIGLLMASEGWTGGPCTFDPASGLQNLPCPQNLLATFSGPGSYTATGKTSHPNSTFIPVAQVPEDLTTVTVAGQQPGGWINNSTATMTLSSQPPVLAGTTVPGAANFLASPIQSITYGISATNNVPQPSAPPSTDTTVENSIACPQPSNPADPPATVFTTNPQTISGLADGNYLLHYYAQDCAGTQEFQFAQDSGGSWSTSYYTFPINVDTIAPVVTSGPVLSPAPGVSNSYFVGQTVTASYSCTDERSGVVRCGASTYSPNSAVLNTGVLTSAVDTSTPGAKNFTVTAIDAAGNQSSASVNYQVSAYNTSIQLSLSPSTVTYPLGTNVVIKVAPTNGHTPTGSVSLYDGAKLLQTAKLQGNGAAYLYVQGFSVGVQQLTATYAGDAHNAAGTSAPVMLNVKPVPVQLTTACWNASFPYGANYNCGIYTSSAAGAPKGVVTYQYDGGAVVTLPLVNGNAQFILSKPPVGKHTVVMGYAAQTNYAAAKPSTVNFTVTLAPVVVQFTPSTYDLTGGSLVLSAAIQSWSAGPPNQIGTVAFTDGSKTLGTVPVSSTGTASLTIAASSLSNGKHTLKATYSGGTNYAAGSSTAVITVAVK